MLKNVSKKELSWIFYDWANSAYTMVVTSTIMSLYFLSSAEAALEGTGGESGGYSQCLLGIRKFCWATIAIVILSPILGTLADYKGKKKNISISF